uniref:Uncharacterized protein n=1 Tax=Candidatus Kentrum sp. TC TaxID=2126339 RepID=A0A450ZLI7_9GAMM|nr:MAG: hypothetical protein BECKTC1821F_GA0114240_100575 [Candidatus Kentron sp. TC]
MVRGEASLEMNWRGFASNRDGVIGAGKVENRSGAGLFHCSCWIHRNRSAPVISGTWKRSNAHAEGVVTLEDERFLAPLEMTNNMCFVIPKRSEGSCEFLQDVLSQ